MEKIEGFFDVCRARGLKGDQGVIIPAANLKHLMLNDEVIEAARAGRFHIHAVENIDQMMEILTDHPAGKRDDQGRFPEGSVNQQAEQRLIGFAQHARAFHAEPGLLPA